MKQRAVVQAESRGYIPILYIYYAEVQPTEAENRLPLAILGKLSGKTSKNCYYNKIFATFVLGCQIGSLILVAFRLLFRKVKRPNLLRKSTIGTLNAHAIWRGCVLICMGTWSSLLCERQYPRFFFF